MYGSKSISGDQKTAIVIITILLTFLYILITLPSDNVGVFMHSNTHKWAKVDTNGVALLTQNGSVIKETKGYHCVLMERSFGYDNHITSFSNNDYESARALYLELHQLEIENPKLIDSGTPMLGLFLVWIGGIILGMFLIFLLNGYDPESFQIISNKLNWGKK